MTKHSNQIQAEDSEDRVQESYSKAKIIEAFRSRHQPHRDENNNLNLWFKIKPFNCDSTITLKYKDCYEQFPYALIEFYEGRMKLKKIKRDELPQSKQVRLISNRQRQSQQAPESQELLDYDNVIAQQSEKRQQIRPALCAYCYSLAASKNKRNHTVSIEKNRQPSKRFATNAAQCSNPYPTRSSV